jgi:hypothetical protein
MLSTEDRNRINCKQYSLNMASVTAGYLLSRAVGIPYQTIDGAWRLFGTAAFSITTGTTATVTILGVVFKNAATQYVGCCTAVSTGYALASANTNSIVCTGTSTSTAYYLEFDLELESKPLFVS